jgi:hypothetical protein
MKELEIEEKLKLLQKEINLLGEDADKAKLDLKEAVGSLKIEIESLKIILKELIPDFQNKFRNVKNTVLKEIDPEWMNEK